MKRKSKTSKASSKKSKGKEISLKSVEEMVLSVLRKSHRFINVKEIAGKISSNRVGNESLLRALSNLVDKGDAKMNDEGKFKSTVFTDFSTTEKHYDAIIEGKLDMNAQGNAYLISDSMKEDVFISKFKIHHALDGDTVRVGLYKRNKRTEGEVLDVLNRAFDTFTGTFEVNKNFAFIISDNAKMPVDIFVGASELHKAKPGDKVAVKITEWHNGKTKKPKGIIVGNLGKPGSNEAEMNSILINNGFDFVFSEEVENEAKKIKDEIPKTEIKKRKDFREILTFTIDPLDAKDFDDAISFRKLNEDRFEIGVHIADVTHFVQPNTALDKEAFKRSTSVYLVDRCIPMLPEKLSNGVCSLRPHEDKLTFSTVFEMDVKGKIYNTWIGKTVIHSQQRFTYEEAQEVLETGKGKYAQELETLNKIAYALRKQKFKNGAIAFEAPEVKFKLDENAKPIGMYVKERKDAHMLIEDYMLLSNKTVAEYIQKKQLNEREIPFVYRIHDLPDSTKLADFNAFVQPWHHKVDLSTPKSISNSLNKIMLKIQGKPEQNIIERMAIKCMAKAAYSSNNIGHYGLAFPNYSHFTSPIRRYSDVVAHRILFENLQSKPYRTDKEKLESECKHISEQERKAMMAERESVKYKQAEYMKDRVGEHFEGFVSGVHDKGFWVEVEGGVEGFVSFGYLQNLWQMNQDKVSIINRQDFEKITIGDIVNVKLTKVDMQKKQLDFMLLEE